MTAPTPEGGASPAPPAGFMPLVTVVDFHHARGPEVEKWFGVPEGSDPAAEYDWTLLPFMALSDGAHASTEDFSYFTLLKPARGDNPATSLFGISCTRQMDASQLLNRPADVTRSTVQKAVVVIADSPQYFGMLRERLSMVTSAWFAQREFTDCEILRRFQESLQEEKERGMLSEEEDRDQYLGLSLRELVREFRWQTLVLLKCCLLQPKMLFFGSRCERLCMMQFSLISLIPGLIRNLQDCGGPELAEYEKRLSKPTSLRTSDRNSLLSYMGLPLQIFGKGSLFGPYTPLQQLDILADFGTKSYIVGSTNSLLLQQKDRYSDILINLDDDTINITSASLRSALALSASDRRWIDFITQEVNDTWDEKNPGRPNHMGYRGSEEFIRLQFEEYLLALISSVKYHTYLTQNAGKGNVALPHVDGDPSMDFGVEWVDYWTRTENYRIWDAHTDSLLFDIIEPKHPCAGGLTVDDVQRRIQQQVQDLHLDERFAAGKEVLGRNAAAAKEKASTMFNKFYADMEAMREAQRKRAEESKAASATLPKNGANTDGLKSPQAASTVGAKAGAYIGSWASWAGEKRKQGWTSRSSSGTSNSGGGWGFGRKKATDSGSEKNGDSPLTSPRISTSGFFSSDEKRRSMFSQAGSMQAIVDDDRPTSQPSFSESVLDGADSEGETSSPVSPRKPQLIPSSPVSSIASRKDKGATEITGLNRVVSAETTPTAAVATMAPEAKAAEPKATAIETPVTKAVDVEKTESTTA
ncbi:late secretory pathway protein avl9 [Neopestalotiopsis sp. 37M]|nr:late secretory pathway protein avl9 [Neopestalotiopsis sp. 37M]